MIDVQCAVQSVVYNKLYSLQYNELHTLKNFKRGQLKITPLEYLGLFEIVLHTLWCIEHYMASCTLNGVLHTAQHTIHCTLQHTWRLDPSKNNSTLLQSFSANKRRSVVTEMYIV